MAVPIIVVSTVELVFETCRVAFRKEEARVKGVGFERGVHFLLFDSFEGVQEHIETGKNQCLIVHTWPNELTATLDFFRRMEEKNPKLRKGYFSDSWEPLKEGFFLQAPITDPRREDLMSMMYGLITTFATEE